MTPEPHTLDPQKAFRVVGVRCGWANLVTDAGTHETGLAVELSARRAGGEPPEPVTFIMHPAEWLSVLTGLLQPVFTDAELGPLLMQFAQAADRVRPHQPPTPQEHPRP